jgi:hypothetical protein
MIRLPFRRQALEQLLELQRSAVEGIGHACRIGELTSGELAARRDLRRSKSRAERSSLRISHPLDIRTL